MPASWSWFDATVVALAAAVTVLITAAVLYWTIQEGRVSGRWASTRERP